MLSKIRKKGKKRALKDKYCISFGHLKLETHSWYIKFDSPVFRIVSSNSTATFSLMLVNTGSIITLKANMKWRNYCFECLSFVSNLKWKDPDSSVQVVIHLHLHLSCTVVYLKSNMKLRVKELQLWNVNINVKQAELRWTVSVLSTHYRKEIKQRKSKVSLTYLKVEE